MGQERNSVRRDDPDGHLKRMEMARKWGLGRNKFAWKAGDLKPAEKEDEEIVKQKNLERQRLLREKMNRRRKEKNL